MNIIFLGTPEFACPSLEALVRGGHRVIAVVTRIDKPAGRGLEVTPEVVGRRVARLLDRPLAVQDAVRGEHDPTAEPLEQVRDDESDAEWIRQLLRRHPAPATRRPG